MLRIPQINLGNAVSITIPGAPVGAYVAAPSLIGTAGSGESIHVLFLSLYLSRQSSQQAMHR